MNHKSWRQNNTKIILIVNEVKIKQQIVNGFTCHNASQRIAEKTIGGTHNNFTLTTLKRDKRLWQNVLYLETNAMFRS